MRTIGFLIIFAATVVATMAATRIGPPQVTAMPASKPDVTQNYGSDPLQFGELRLPEGKGPFPVAIVIHGGCWTKGYATLRMMAPIATELTKNGIATWNIEYRQVGDAGGGWPGTFLDWANAADHLKILAKSHPLDLTRIISVGHSAGGHAALWLAARHRLPAESPLKVGQPVGIRAAVNIDGPADIIGFVGIDREVCGKPVIAKLMGGTPEEQMDRYKQVSPPSLLPFETPQFLISSEVLTEAKAREYRTSANNKGDTVEILSLKTGHFEVIAPGHEAWLAVEKIIVGRALAKE